MSVALFKFLMWLNFVLMGLNIFGRIYLKRWCDTLPWFIAIMWAYAYMSVKGYL